MEKEQLCTYASNLSESLVALKFSWKIPKIAILVMVDKKNCLILFEIVSKLATLSTWKFAMILRWKFEFFLFSYSYSDTVYDHTM